MSTIAEILRKNFPDVTKKQIDEIERACRPEVKTETVKDRSKTFVVFADDKNGRTGACVFVATDGDERKFQTPARADLGVKNFATNFRSEEVKDRLLIIPFSLTKKDRLLCSLRHETLPDSLSTLDLGGES